MGTLSATSPTVPAVDKAMERRLARVAKLADDYKNERDALIVMAFLAGAGVREIARAVNMSHPAVKYIVEKNAENPAIVEEQKRRDEYRGTWNQPHEREHLAGFTSPHGRGMVPVFVGCCGTSPAHGRGCLGGSEHVAGRHLGGGHTDEVPPLPRPGCWRSTLIGVRVAATT